MSVSPSISKTSRSPSRVSLWSLTWRQSTFVSISTVNTDTRLVHHLPGGPFPAPVPTGRDSCRVSRRRRQTEGWAGGDRVSWTPGSKHELVSKLPSVTVSATLRQDLHRLRPQETFHGEQGPVGLARDWRRDRAGVGATH